MLFVCNIQLHGTLLYFINLFSVLNWLAKKYFNYLCENLQYHTLHCMEGVVCGLICYGVYKLYVHAEVHHAKVIIT